MGSRCFFRLGFPRWTLVYLCSFSSLNYILSLHVLSYIHRFAHQIGGRVKHGRISWRDAQVDRPKLLSLEVQDEGHADMQGFVVVGPIWQCQSRQDRCSGLGSHPFQSNDIHKVFYITTLMMKQWQMCSGRRSRACLKWKVPWIESQLLERLWGRDIRMAWAWSSTWRLLKGS